MTSSATFDLEALFVAIDAERHRQELSWAALSREVGVAATTIRRYAHADDAEADGVLALIRWLDIAPEVFIVGSEGEGERLAGSRGKIVRVDMDEIRTTDAGAHIPIDRTRTTIQRLVRLADCAGRPVVSFTRSSDS